MRDNGWQSAAAAAAAHAAAAVASCPADRKLSDGMWIADSTVAINLAGW